MSSAHSNDSASSGASAAPTTSAGTNARGQALKDLSMAARRKNRYLSRLINYLLEDPQVLSILQSDQMELQKDCQLVNLLLTFLPPPGVAEARDQDGFVTDLLANPFEPRSLNDPNFQAPPPDSYGVRPMYNLDVVQKEMAEVVEFYKTNISAKSQAEYEEMKKKGDDLVARKTAQSAPIYYSKAIRALPGTAHGPDLKKLAQLYVARMKCWLHMRKYDQARLDAELALQADPGAQFPPPADDKEKEVFERAKSGTFSRKCSTGVHINKSVTIVSSGAQNRYKMMAQNTIPANESIIIESPFVRYDKSPLASCNRCGVYLNNIYWPCHKCVDVGYCSKDCWNDNQARHSYECGLTSYISQIPLLLVMLRFYCRTKRHPTDPCPSHRDWVHDFVEALKEEGAKKAPELALNAFRQSMDRSPGRTILSRYWDQYLACIILSIEFMYLYPLCLKQFHDPTDANLTKSVNAAAQNWMGQHKPQDVITLIFRDMKRFIACPGIKFRSTIARFTSNNRRTARMVYILMNMPKVKVDFKTVVANANTSWGNGNNQLVTSACEILRNETVFMKRARK